MSPDTRCPGQHLQAGSRGQASPQSPACGARKYDSACWSAFPQCRRSGGDLILVSESVEDLFPPDPVLGEVDRFWWPGAGLGRGELSEGTVWPRGVVVLQVLGHHPAQVMLIDDQQPVEEFPAEGADDPLADCVRSGRLRGAGENSDPLRGEHGVEGAGELACAVPD